MNLNQRLRILFIHPDLGIGGAERLVVDAALALKSKHHDPWFLTSHHDMKHSFPETQDGRIAVMVCGNYIPRSIFGYFSAFFAYIRSIYTVLYLLFWARCNFDLAFVDQISAPIYFLKKFSNKKVIFYCHFPDQLLAKKGGWLRKLYRMPINWVEEYTTGLADCILVNSEFTAAIFRDTFKSLKDTYLEVVSPCVSKALFQKSNEPTDIDQLRALLPKLRPNFFLSLNRYEEKKDIGLAIHSLEYLKNKVPKEEFAHVQLVVAGGYDPDNYANIACYKQLKYLVKTLKLENHVRFLKSPSDDIKACLLLHCLCLVYTPSNEHFGIVPVEAMLCRRPVIAISNGGPLETIVHNETGLLVEATNDDFSDAMKCLWLDRNLGIKMGMNGRDRVLDLYMLDILAEKLNTICQALYHGAVV